MTTINDQMAAWGRKGGASRSEKKRAAARRNVAAARARIGKAAVPAQNQSPELQPTLAPPAVEHKPQRPAVLVAVPAGATNATD